MGFSRKIYNQITFLWNYFGNIWIINIAFDKFIEKEGLSPDAVDRDNFGINSKDFTYGSIEKILVHKDIIIMQYAEGLTEAEYKAASEGLDNPMDLFSKLFAANKSQFGLLGADGQIKPITLPERVGNIEFIDQEGNIWISYNREEELDYELIFKAKLKAVPLFAFLTSDTVVLFVPDATVLLNLK